MTLTAEQQVMPDEMREDLTERVATLTRELDGVNKILAKYLVEDWDGKTVAGVETLVDALWAQGARINKLTDARDDARATATRCQAASTTDVEMRRTVANDYRWYRENVLLVVEAESDGWRDAGTTADKRAGGVEACETILKRIAALSLRPTCSPVTTHVKKLRAALLEFGSHDEDCVCMGDTVGHTADCANCDCGLRAALEATKEVENVD